MSSSKLSTTLPHDNLVTFFKMTELLHFCNKIEKCLLHLFLKACSFDLPSASTDFFDKSFKNLSDRQTDQINGWMGVWIDFLMDVQTDS